MAESPEPDLAKTVAKLAERHAAHSQSFLATPGHSIRPTLANRAAARSEPPAPPVLAGSGLELGAVLGEGGMGVVRVGQQRVLRREVAVKSVQPRLQSDLATRMLMQEALVVGRLEHPNVLPIYDIRYDQGQPQLLLKKIEGVQWLSVMHDAAAVKKLFGADDLLTWNLDVLQQVCNGIHFAHSRGIVHRDLKPENVMLGHFGEVYVMDWGLAVALEDDGSGMLPLASMARELAGTPSYMAPEMLGGGETLISPRTDVYLLGAILYEILARQPPHQGATLQAMLVNVLASRPPLPHDCPAELARICRMAMDPDPGWRQESAEVLRQALHGFLRHAGSRRLATRAIERGAELQRLASMAGSLAYPTLEKDLDGIYTECRIGFLQALEIWPGNEEARDGLDAATRFMTEHQLAHDNPRGAAALLATLRTPPQELRARVEAAVLRAEQADNQLQSLQRLRNQLDARTGARSRAIGAGVLGVVWTVAPVLTPRIVGETKDGGYTASLIFLSAMIVAIVTWARVSRKEMAESSVTRRMMGAALVAMFVQLMLNFATFQLGIPPEKVQAIWPLTWFSVSAMLVINVDRRLWPMATGFLASSVAAMFWPEWRFWAMGACNLVMTVNMFSIWMPNRVAPPPAAGKSGGQ